MLLCTSEKAEPFRLGFGGLTRLVYQQLQPACQQTCHGVLVDVSTVKPQKDTVLPNLPLFGDRQDRSQRKVETDCLSCGHKANMRAPWHIHLQKLHWRAKIEEIPRYLSVQQPPKKTTHLFRASSKPQLKLLQT